MGRGKIWTKNLVLITLVNFFMFSSFQLFPTALPLYIKSLGAPDALLGLLQGALTVAVLLIRPFAGVILDRRGRKGIFLVGILGMLVATGAYALFPVVAAILAIRFFHGVVWGVASTACSTVASDNIEKAHFAEGMGYFSLASSIALAIAPAIALSLSIERNVLLAVGFLIVALLLALQIDYHRPGLTLPEEKKPLVLYAKESILSSFLILFIMMTWGAVVTFLALYGAQRSIGSVGLFFTTYAVTVLLTRPFFGRWIDRKGFGVGIWSGVICIPAALVLLCVSSSLPAFLLCAMLYGIGAGAAMSSLQTMAIVNVPRENIGAANATFFTGLDAGIGLGAVVAGVLSSVTDYGSMFALMALCPLFAGILYLLAGRRKKMRE